jgi:hypothetical protein
MLLISSDEDPDAAYSKNTNTLSSAVSSGNFSASLRRKSLTLSTVVSSDFKPSITYVVIKETNAIPSSSPTSASHDSKSLHDGTETLVAKYFYVAIIAGILILVIPTSYYSYTRYTRRQDNPIEATVYDGNIDSGMM